MEFDPRKEAFFDRKAVHEEIRRVFQCCHGCRLCSDLCPSFQSLFEGLDKVEGETARLGREQVNRVVDLCTQCKLCFEKCPYTPPHGHALDFPRLVLRARATAVRERGMPLRDRILNATDTNARLAGLVAPLVNWANRNSLHRVLLEKTLGIDRRRRLPIYHKQSFEAWFRQRLNPPKHHPDAPKVAIFATCSVNHNRPELGRALVRVLERNGISVSLPPQRCCGMPSLESGDVNSAMSAADANVASLARAVQEGAVIVSPEPTCTYLLRNELVHLARDKQAAREVSNHTFDACEYLMQRHSDGKLDTGFGWTPGRLAYQIPCHLKVQDLGTRSRDLMRLLPGSDVRLIERCAGMDGTRGMKQEHYELALGVAGKLFREIEETAAELVVTDCSAAALRIEQGLGLKPLHPIEVLDHAYRGVKPEPLS